MNICEYLCIFAYLQYCLETTSQLHRPPLDHSASIDRPKGGHPITELDLVGDKAGDPLTRDDDLFASDLRIARLEALCLLLAQFCCQLDTLHSTVYLGHLDLYKSATSSFFSTSTSTSVSFAVFCLYSLPLYSPASNTLIVCRSRRSSRRIPAASSAQPYPSSSCRLDVGLDSLLPFCPLAAELAPYLHLPHIRPPCSTPRSFLCEGSRFSSRRHPVRCTRVPVLCAPTPHAHARRFSLWTVSGFWLLAF